MNGFTVRIADWAFDETALAAVRREVFVVEQQVCEEEEWDGKDPRCRHVIAEDAAGNAVGTGRLLPDGHIGRMAVLRPWRGRGVGRALLTQLTAMAREAGFSETRLHAQTHAMGFYARQGYTAVGEEFMEAGIPHIEMVLRL
jgi:predicted GNAT family N-acyltransferase